MTIEKFKNLIVGKKIKSVKVSQAFYTMHIEQIELEDGTVIEFSVDWRNDLVEVELVKSDEQKS